jgi:hypothetical protein
MWCSAMCDPTMVHQLVDGAEVYHLAALGSIPYSYAAPRSYVGISLIDTVNVLDAVRAFRTPRLVQTSTSETYGTARTAPISEQHPLQAQSRYAASKIVADKLVESYHLSFEVPAVTPAALLHLRPTAVRRRGHPPAGPGCPPTQARRARSDGGLHLRHRRSAGVRALGTAPASAGVSPICPTWTF